MAIPGHGNIRRVTKPKPFVRPSMNIGGTDDAQREWRDIPIEQVQPGDTVVDLGLIKTVEHSPNPALRQIRVGLENIYGKRLYVIDGKTVKAFVKVDG